MIPEECLFENPYLPQTHSIGLQGEPDACKKMNMKHSKRVLQIFSILFLLTGCFGLFDNGSKRITGEYILIWIDLPESQSIIKEWKDTGGGETVVPEYVYAVGYNDDFIIAKQHPTSGFKDGYRINDKITNYYIIDMHNKVIKSGNNVIGPLSKQKFDSLRNGLRINDIEFEINYPENNN